MVHPALQITKEAAEFFGKDFIEKWELEVLTDVEMKEQRDRQRAFEAFKN